MNEWLEHELLDNDPLTKFLGLFFLAVLRASFRQLLNLHLKVKSVLSISANQFSPRLSLLSPVISYFTSTNIWNTSSNSNIITSVAAKDRASNANWFWLIQQPLKLSIWDLTNPDHSFIFYVIFTLRNKASLIFFNHAISISFTFQWHECSNFWKSL